MPGFPPGAHLLAAWLCLLAGCALKPPAPPMAGPARVAVMATQASFTAPVAPWPSDGWWQGLADPQLARLMALALREAPDMRAAAARVARAQALAGQANSALWPSLRGAGQMGYTKQSYNYIIPPDFSPKGWKDYGQTTLDLSWDLDFWGKNRAAAAAADLDAQMAQAEAAQSRLVLSTAIAAAYVTLLRDYTEQDAAREALAVRAHTADLLQARFRLGLENAGVVERAQSSLASAKADLASVGEDIALTQNQIAMLAGQGPDFGLTLHRPAETAMPAFGLPLDLKLHLLARRPDIMAAKLRVAAAARRIHVASAAFYPDISISADIGLQALGLSRLVKTGSDYGMAGPALSLPLFDGGMLRGQYRAAEADYMSAVAQYDATLLQALREVADTAASARALVARLDNSKLAAAHAARAWESAQRRYKGGLANYLDVLTAEDNWVAARRTAAALQTRAFALNISLIRALGGGFVS